MGRQRGATGARQLEALVIGWSAGPGSLYDGPRIDGNTASKHRKMCALAGLAYASSATWPLMENSVSAHLPAVGPERSSRM
ncbi:hypothetical protein MAE02_61120 [Microvirga aerophila]|uniref:Uncharacterized protein n=1 Tax=Microvirga aerophila TaxID=670291 RepID=A0A512C2I4_9HYPH|nr:hypothetical protein MAE02_61120 [Microvirga aerophila]